MARKIKEFLNNAKGAVTVFISLLMIPAILVSGTAVDLARIHSARSVLQDANQLAANSVLTQYNALLHDLYGLFGVAEQDPILGALVDDYIKVSVFGESVQDRSLGTLQVFYGSDVSLDDFKFNGALNLDNPDVLRRQIEEYMKFRGPVIIVKEVIEALEKNNVKADKEIIEDKTDIDSGLADLWDKYKELYIAILTADACDLVTYHVGNVYYTGIVSGHFANISQWLKLIRLQFIDLKNCYSEWASLKYIPSPDDKDGKAYNEYLSKKNDIAAKYNKILANIGAYTIGGIVGRNWVEEKVDWGSPSTVIGLNYHVDCAKQKAIEFKQKFDNVLKLAREVDEMNSELSKKLDELERKLNTGECSEELRSSLTEKHGNPPMSLIERYRDILKWKNVTAMANTYKNGGYSYIDNDFIPLVDGVKYRNSDNPSAGSLTREQLADLSSVSGFQLSEGVPAAISKAAVFAAFPENSVTYEKPPGFKKFAEHPGENAAFYKALVEMMNQPELKPVKIYDDQEEDKNGSTAREKQENMIKALLKLINSAYIGLTNSPLGALRIEDEATPEPERLNIIDIMTMIPEVLSNPVVGVIQDPVGSLGKAGDYILLLTYCTSMFSNYTTTRPESVDKRRDDLSGINFPKSLTGVPISPRVNYFFQSEWEYLYHGSNTAGANLSAITRLLFIVRMVCNYIKVFSVAEVTAIVTSIQTAFAWCPPVGVVLGELARAAFAAAETMVDIAALRTGHKVPLIKNADSWVCSPSGVIAALGKAASGAAADGGGSGSETKNEKGLTYSNYMLFFFVAKSIFYFRPEGDAATELAIRTGNLIEWNIINYQKQVNANEEKMAEAVKASDRFMLKNMNTSFSLTTSASMRMLFLSMPLAQRGINGIFPPETLAITATDHRGY